MEGERGKENEIEEGEGKKERGKEEGRKWSPTF